MTVAEYGEIPADMLHGVALWVAEARYPGGFLRSVLENDLRNAVLRGDRISLAALPPLVIYLHREIPAEAWGSRERMVAWAARPQPARVDAVDAARILARAAREPA